MIRLTAQSLLIAMLSSAPAMAGSAEFSCTGPFGRDSSRAALVKAFGASSISEQKVDDRGDDTLVTIVFPNDRQRRLIFRWRDEKQRRGISSVTIRSPDWSALGASVGLSLVEVERLNRKPFKIIDYEGDSAGGVTTWQGGKFDAKLLGGCSLGATFAVGTTDLNVWKSDNGLVSSDDAAFRAASKSRLSELIAFFPVAGSGK